MDVPLAVYLRYDQNRMLSISSLYISVFSRGR